MPDFVVFEDFIKQVDTARVQHHINTLERGIMLHAPPEVVAAEQEPRKATRRKGASAKRAAVAEVEPNPEFKKMRDFILNFYGSAKSQHTFLDASGNHVDCIPIDKQPGYLAARAARHSVRAEPSTPVTKRKRGKATADNFGPYTSLVMPPLLRGKTDQFGNPVACPEGCVPIRRITLPRMTRLGLFENFFKKGHVPTPVAGGPLPFSNTPGPDGYLHHHAIASSDGGPFFGCASYMNVWGRNPAPGEMNLSQFWLVRPISGGLPHTIEGGWQIDAPRSGTDAPVLFVFFNPDGYGPGSGYFVNKMGQGFIQTSPNWVMNSDLPASAMDGQQLGFRMQWEQKDSGDWYMYIGGDNPDDPLEEIGYIPGGLYHGDTFNTAQFGGEVANRPPSTSTGPMGSGSAPLSPLKESFRRVAFQRNISVQPDVGGSWEPASLTAFTPDRPYYDCAVGQSDKWGTYIFFGGDGAP
jgi:hypothetical protein